MDPISKIIVANWKMSGTKTLIDQFSSGLRNQPPCRPAIFCPSYPLLDYAHTHFPPSIQLGAQDCSQFISGAKTGEVSALHLLECGCSFVIVGHSERRTLHHETNAIIAAKAVLAIEHHLTPIVCIGETESAYESHKTKETLEEQITSLRPLLTRKSPFILAYEPIWAIGTGRVPSLKEIDEIHSFIYQKAHVFPLYGGSVNYENYREILQIASVSGVLVGGESLKPDCFIPMLVEK